MIYGGFWVRLGAHLIDFAIMLPMLALIVWGYENFRLFALYFFIPGTLFGFFYSVYLVQRFGGTPGKRVMNLRIVRVDGKPLTYREALLRYLPEWLLSAGSSVGGILAVTSLTDAEYFAPTSFSERAQIIEAAMPSWDMPLRAALNIWIWSEFLVMLTNRKRRAIHDFIAGTVVIRDGHADPTGQESQLDPSPPILAEPFIVYFPIDRIAEAVNCRHRIMVSLPPGCMVGPINRRVTEARPSPWFEVYFWYGAEDQVQSLLAKDATQFEVVSPQWLSAGQAPA